MTNRLTTVHNHHHEPDEEEDLHLFHSAVIYDADMPAEGLPSGFDAIRIKLDGTLKADLKWEAAHEKALRALDKGLNVFWDMDLGIFDRLQYPIGNQSQFLSLGLSLEHFRDTLWKEFRTNTFGLCLYRGSADLSYNYPWDQEQLANFRDWLRHKYEDEASFIKETGVRLNSFAEITPQLLQERPLAARLVPLFCRDAAAEYLDMLANRLPDVLTCMVLLDASGIRDPLLQAQILSKERYPRFCIGVKGVRGMGGELAWEQAPFAAGMIGCKLDCIENIKFPEIGICLPSIDYCRFSDVQGLDRALAFLTGNKLEFKVVPESCLTSEWDGLNELIVLSQKIDNQGKRKLRGFCAAGGEVVYIGDSLGLPKELPFNEWMKLKNIG